MRAPGAPGNGAVNAYGADVPGVFPLFAAQILAVPSSLPVASQLPFGEIATAATSPVWPVRVARRLPSGPQIIAFRSLPPVASHDPSGEIAIAFTWPVWPDMGARGVPSIAQIPAVLVVLALMS